MFDGSATNNVSMPFRSIAVRVAAMRRLYSWGEKSEAGIRV